MGGGATERSGCPQEQPSAVSQAAPPTRGIILRTAVLYHFAASPGVRAVSPGEWLGARASVTACARRSHASRPPHSSSGDSPLPQICVPGNPGSGAPSSGCAWGVSEGPWPRSHGELRVLRPQPFLVWSPADFPSVPGSGLHGSWLSIWRWFFRPLSYPASVINAWPLPGL